VARGQANLKRHGARSGEIAKHNKTKKESVNSLMVLLNYVDYMLRNVAEIVLEFSGKVRRIPQNLGARSDKTERDRREVRRDMSEILTRSAVSDRYLSLLAVT
jgi:hypothetical protein